MPRGLRRWLVLLIVLVAFLGGMWAALSSETPPTDTMNVVPVTPTFTPRPQPTLAPIAQDLIAKHQPSNPPRGDVRLLVVSDLNDSFGKTDYPPEVKQGMALIPFWGPDLILMAGDMVAGQKLTLSTAQLQAMWQGFDTHVMAALRSYGIPLAITIGNHDASSARNHRGGFIFEQERNIATQYWRDPKHDLGVEYVDRQDFPFYYTFLDHNIFYLVWDGSSSFIPPDKQAWVEQSLASQVAQEAKMRILIGHLPLYAVAQGRDRPGEVMNSADDWRALLERYRVHTYISGHHHAYYAGQRGQLDLLHMGILGAGPRLMLTGSRIGSGKNLTVVDIWFGDPPRTVYHTYEVPSLRPIELAELPRFMLGHNGVVRRRDVPELSPDEMSRCRQRLSIARCQG